jgi:hypothetical protein
MLPPALGSYFWSGYDVRNALVPGLVLLQQAGFTSTTRIRLTPGVRPLSATDRGEYRFDIEWEAEVPVGVPFLPAAVRSTQYQRAFALPDLRTFVLQTYDSASYEHLHQDPTWTNANSELIRSEYRDMTVALYETQNGTGKRFIVSNWETDNSIYLDSKPGPKSATVLEGFTQWFRLRQEGIRQGREIATAQGWGGIEVNDAIEFTRIYFAKEYASCFPVGYVGDTLHNIIKDVKPDYASYSAWESTGRYRLYDDLVTARQILHSETNGHTQLMIGELGVTHQSDPSFPPTDQNVQSKAWRYIQLVHSAIRAEIPVIILWKAWDAFGIYEGEGLFNSDGSERPILKDLQNSFGTSVLITGVIDQFDMYGWRAPDQKRHFELYGHFPGARDGNPDQPGWIGNYHAIAVFADGGVIGLKTEGESESQVNIALTPHTNNVRWFLVRVLRKYDGMTSGEFGPVRLNRVPPTTTNCQDNVTQRHWDYGHS